ncbi:RluA family pseudouridine synthase [Sulfurivirga caldicuralii]|nr:RNA pseudouridine synthase [Sulfurivirga caldicuralii]
MKGSWHGRVEAPMRAVDALAQLSGLSRGAVKRAMNAGAAWTKEKGRRVRLRKATRLLPAGTPVWLYYDEAVLSQPIPEAQCVRREKGWSVWFKPAGLLTQGNQWGDAASLLRQAERALGRPVWLVHRLDRETAGLVLLAHHRQAAGALSRQFQQRQVEKGYRAWVKGEVREGGMIALALDGKPARTRFEVVRTVAAPLPMTEVDITLETGRLHQIRRHFAELGHPVVGDPRYGGAAPLPLQLLAYRLRFRDLSDKVIEAGWPRAQWAEAGFYQREEGVA